MKKSASIINLFFVLLSICLTGCHNSNEQNFYLQESQTYKGITITVNSITESDYYSTSTGYNVDAKEGKRFIAVELTIENNSGSDLSFYSSEFLLIETENKAEVESVNYVLDDKIIDLDVSPYETVNGIVRFYVSETFASKAPFIFKYTYTDYDVAFLWEEIELEWFLTERTN